MDVLDRLDEMIDERHLLKHPFYTKWAEGTLPFEALQEYARQYYAFESAMPRYLSALHTRTADRAVRQQILDNLWDEEHGKDNHAELWLRFAEGIGVSREDVQTAAPNEATQALTDMYCRGHAGSAGRGRSRRAVRLRAPGPPGCGIEDRRSRAPLRHHRCAPADVLQGARRARYRALGCRAGNAGRARRVRRMTRRSRRRLIVPLRRGGTSSSAVDQPVAAA